MTARTSATDDSGSSRWLAVLLAVGVALTVGGVALVALVLSDALSAPWLSGLSLGIWGPICLVLWALIRRHRRKVARFKRDGITTRATVRSILPGGGQVNGQPLLKLAVTVAVPGRADVDTTVRTVAPHHLVSILRPGVTVPVLVDPTDASKVWLDWSEVERETTPTP